jgi:hypothetical protein
MSQGSRFCVLLLFACGVCAPVQAQQSGTRVSAFFGGTFGEEQANIGAGGTVGYRFTPSRDEHL